MVMCGSFIVLSAEIVNDVNLRNHTLYWEQIDGEDVVIEDTSKQTTGYFYNENSNKTFRLWLDYGTAGASFKDITIYHVPTSILRAQATRGVKHHLAQTTGSHTVSGTRTIPVSPSPAKVPATVVLELTYTPLAADLLAALQRVDVYSVTPQHLPDALISSHTSPVPASIPVPEGYSILKYVYMLAGVLRTYASPLLFIGPQAAPSDAYINETLAVCGSTGVLNKVTFLRRSGPRKKYVQDSFSGQTYGRINGTIARNKHIKKFINVTVNPGGTYSTSHAVIRLDPSSIGA